MPTISLYANSLRHLRPVQVSSRLRLLAYRKLLHRNNSVVLERYGCPVDVDTNRLSLQDPVPVQQAQAELAENRFTFLNHTENLGEPIDWFPSDATQLWQYNLHYFDYTVGLAEQYVQLGDKSAYATFRRLASSWMEACPLPTPLAWDPYPISLRATNWIKAYVWFEPELEHDLNFAQRLRQSIWSQIRFLMDHLEYHLLGNHLIENGRALLFAGFFFQDSQAEGWRQKGLEILIDELEEQFLSDGGHYERSPMYHQIMLHLYTDVADLMCRQSIDVPTEMKSGIAAMRSWLGAMVHPDGEIALFNDAAFAIAGSPVHQMDHTKVSDGFQPLPASGYFVFRNQAAGDYLALDCGPLGPDYQPGHGHCDMLSYELSLQGKRMIVDTGVGSYYGDLAWRQYYRSTYAHNTLVIDGQEQSEIWGRFRVGRRAYPKDVQYDSDGALAYAAGSHTGYERLAGDIRHRRWLGWIDQRFWLVVDQVAGAGKHSIESLLHFHPDVEIIQPPHSPSFHVQVGRENSRLMIIPWGITSAELLKGEREPIQGWYAPEFGKDIANPVLSYRAALNAPSWLGYLLWPEEGDVSVELAQTAEAECRIIIKADGTQYHVTCDANGMKLEKS